MKRIVGLDLSLTATGIAVVTKTDRGYRLTASTVTSKGRRDASVLERDARLRELEAGIVHHAVGAELVVIEAPFSGVRGGSPIDRDGLHWIVYRALIARGVPLALIPPTSLKLAIAGAGNADKAAVSSAVTKMWPDLEIGSSDVADAAGLAHLGAVHWGWGVRTLERHKQVKAEWPS